MKNKNNNYFEAMLEAMKNGNSISEVIAENATVKLTEADEAAVEAKMASRNK